MDELDCKIVQIMADSGDDFITAYQVTAKLYPELGSEGVSAIRPKIRNRITKIETFDILESVKQNGIRKYRLKDGAYVTNSASLHVLFPGTEEKELAFNAGPVLVFPVEDEFAVIVLDSWVS